jgi:hypothetical protein
MNLDALALTAGLRCDPRLDAHHSQRARQDDPRQWVAGCLRWSHDFASSTDW